MCHIYTDDELHFVTIEDGTVVDTTFQVCYYVGWKYDEFVEHAKKEGYEVSEPKEMPHLK